MKIRQRLIRVNCDMLRSLCVLACKCGVFMALVVFAGCLPERSVCRHIPTEYEFLKYVEETPLGAEESGTPQAMIHFNELMSMDGTTHVWIILPQNYNMVMKTMRLLGLICSIVGRWMTLSEARADGCHLLVERFINSGEECASKGKTASGVFEKGEPFFDFLVTLL